ncbi:MAG: M48 family metallopeptidase [Opitutales bacterium]|nr:M48 family metallopeptidase [Opitutales bacterium]
MKKAYSACIRLSALCFALILGGCATGPTLVPESMLASEAAGQFEQMKREMTVSTDPAYVEPLMRVGERIAEVATPYMDRVDWEFVVFADDTINAFAMPGGKIGFYTGIMDLAESEDELAVVMGHEVAHVLLKHGNQRVSAELLRIAGAAALAYGIRDQDQHLQAAILAGYGLGSEIGVMLPYSRHHETEADEVGLILMFMAGYDPDAAARFWSRMEELSDSRTPQWLSTHPHPGNRVRNLERLAAELKANPPESLGIRRR